MKEAEATALADFINKWDRKYQARTEKIAQRAPSHPGTGLPARTVIFLNARPEPRINPATPSRRRSPAIPIHHAGEYLTLLGKRRTKSEPSVAELEARLTDWLLD